MTARRTCTWLAALLACIALVGGCSDDVKETAKKVKKKVQKKVDQTTEIVAKKLGIVGGMEFEMGEPLKVSACYVALHTFKDQRPGALQLKTYQKINQETFPSVFIQAPVRVNNLQQLAGQTLQAQMYVMTEKDGPVWHGGSVELKITAVEGKKIGGEIVSGTLSNASDGASVNVAGKFGGQL